MDGGSFRFRFVADPVGSNSGNPTVVQTFGESGTSTTQLDGQLRVSEGNLVTQTLVEGLGAVLKDL